MEDTTASKKGGLQNVEEKVGGGTGLKNKPKKRLGENRNYENILQETPSDADKKGRAGEAIAV